MLCPQSTTVSAVLGQPAELLYSKSMKICLRVLQHRAAADATAASRIPLLVSLYLVAAKPGNDAGKESGAQRGYHAG